jgi:phosphohistidine phosphatase
VKRLYLIRHAKSSWKDPDLADFERPLNRRGKKDAPFMGKRLKKYGVKPDLIISSPAKRALKSATIIANEIDFPTKKIITDMTVYQADVPNLLDLIQNIDDSNSQVMLIGHNPDLTSLANYLSNYAISNIPTCGIFCIDFEISSWKNVAAGKGIFKFFDYPKKHQ